MTEFVKTFTEGGVSRIVLSRPERHNAFNEVMMGEITESVQECAAHPHVRVIVLSAAGECFSAGADINWMKRVVDYTFEENVNDTKVLAGMLRAIRECPKPVIARVQGAAMGGGVGLVAACDMAVAVERAFFCLSEVRLGIIPAVISPFVISKIGLSPMRRYALTAERFDAVEAKRIGLINEVELSDAEMDAWIGEVVAALRGNGPEALAACKRVLQDVEGLNWDEVGDLTARRIAERRVSPEGQEGLRAFLEKRPPAWTRD